MSKKEQITYALFIKTANDLKAEGQTPSVRLIRTRIGGSNSTLLEYMRRWLSEAALAATVDDNISDALKQALLAEFGRVVQSTRQKLETQLTQERQQSKEANELLVEAENRIAELEEKYQLDKVQTAQTILALEKQLAATNERVSELQRQGDKLEQQLKESVIAQEIARVEAAKAQLQVERADKAMEKAEKQADVLQEKGVKLQQEMHQAQIKAAVAESKMAELEKRMDKQK